MDFEIDGNVCLFEKIHEYLRIKGQHFLEYLKQFKKEGEKNN